MEHGSQSANRSWTTRRDEKKRRMQSVSSWMSGPLLRQDKLVQALENLIAPSDRIVMEGDNQKQADFLSRSLVKVDAEKIHDLHLIISSISRPGCANPPVGLLWKPGYNGMVISGSFFTGTKE